MGPVDLGFSVVNRLVDVRVRVPINIHALARLRILRDVRGLHHLMALRVLRSLWSFGVLDLCLRLPEGNKRHGHKGGQY